MKTIIDYIVAALKALFALFGAELPGLEEGTEDNIESMLGGLGLYEPEVAPMA